MGSETKVSEMETTVEDLQWDIEKLRKREQKLNKLLAEGMDQVRVDHWVVCVCCTGCLLTSWSGGDVVMRACLQLILFTSQHHNVNKHQPPAKPFKGTDAPLLYSCL